MVRTALAGRLRLRIIFLGSGSLVRVLRNIGAPLRLGESSTAYDDMMEIMKVWYVITYRSSSDLDPDAPRSVRVARVDPSTGDPLRIVDANGKTIPASVVAEVSDTLAKSCGEKRWKSLPIRLVPNLLQTPLLTSSSVSRL